MDYDDERAGRVARRIGVLVLVALAALIGWLFGRQPEPAPVVTECPPPPEQTACDPCVCLEEESVSVPSATVAPTPRVRRRLPPANPDPPASREAVLAWVRARTPELRRCPTSRPESDPLHLTVRLQLDDEGQVTSARARSILPEALPRPVRNCLEERLSRWQLPPELQSERRDYIFSLRL